MIEWEGVSLVIVSAKLKVSTGSEVLAPGIDRLGSSCLEEVRLRRR